MWKLIDIAGFAYLTHTSVIIYKYQCTKTNNIIYIIEEEEEEYEDDCISHLYSINNDDFKTYYTLNKMKEIDLSSIKKKNEIESIVLLCTFHNVNK
jgi:hypothetical protein